MKNHKKTFTYEGENATVKVTVWLEDVENRYRKSWKEDVVIIKDGKEFEAKRFNNVSLESEEACKEYGLKPTSTFPIPASLFNRVGKYQQQKMKEDSAEANKAKREWEREEELRHL